MKRKFFSFAFVITLVSCTQTIPVESIQVSQTNIRLEVGEGIEKRNDDFAAEVAAQAASAKSKN